MAKDNRLSVFPLHKNSRDNILSTSFFYFLFFKNISMKNIVNNVNFLTYDSNLGLRGNIADLYNSSRPQPHNSFIFIRIDVSVKIVA